MAYDGTVDDDSPVHGYAVSFNVREYLHIKVNLKLRGNPLSTPIQDG